LQTIVPLWQSCKPARSRVSRDSRGSKTGPCPTRRPVWAARSQESETYLPRGSLISPGFFRSVLVMLVGSYESAQNLCRGLEQG
jgi:hypothetical protein